MTFKRSLITLALLSSLAACGGGGGSSSSPTPSPSPAPIPTVTVTINGQVDVTNSDNTTIEASIGTVKETVTVDAQGKYSVALTVNQIQANQLISLKAQKEGSALGLQARLGTMNEVIDMAGSDSILDSSENKWTELNAFNTAVSYVLSRSHLTEPLNSYSAISAQMRKITSSSVMPVYYLLLLAEQSSTNTDYSLPAGVSNVHELLGNYDKLREYYAAMKANGALDTIAEQTINSFDDFESLPLQAADFIDDFYSSSTWSRLAPARWTLNSDGTGAVYGLTVSYDSQSSVPFTWQLVGGQLEMTIDPTIDASGWFSGRGIVRKMVVKTLNDSLDFSGWLIKTTYEVTNSNDGSTETKTDLTYVNVIKKDGLLSPAAITGSANKFIIPILSRNRTFTNKDIDRSFDVFNSTLGRVSFNTDESTFTYELRHDYENEQLSNTPTTSQFSILDDQKTLYMKALEHNEYVLLNRRNDGFEVQHSSTFSLTSGAMETLGKVVITSIDESQLGNDNFEPGIYQRTRYQSIINYPSYTWYEINQDGTLRRVVVNDINANGVLDDSEVYVYQGFWQMGSGDTIRMRYSFAKNTELTGEYGRCESSDFRPADNALCVATSEREWEIYSNRNNKLRFVNVFKLLRNDQRNEYVGDATGDAMTAAFVGYGSSEKVAQAPFDISNYPLSDNNTPYIWKLLNEDTATETSEYREQSVNF